MRAHFSDFSEIFLRFRGTFLSPTRSCDMEAEASRRCPGDPVSALCGWFAFVGAWGCCGARWSRRPRDSASVSNSHLAYALNLFCGDNLRTFAEISFIFVLTPRGRTVSFETPRRPVGLQLRGRARTMARLASNLGDDRRGEEAAARSLQRSAAGSGAVFDFPPTQPFSIR